MKVKVLQAALWVACLSLGDQCRSQSAIEVAEALLARVEQLAKAERPITTEEQRCRLLQEADTVCDAAATAGGDAARAFGVRWGLARQAYLVGEWPVAAVLYGDCVAAYGDDTFGSLEAKRLAGESNSMLQLTRPFAERNFGKALQLLGEVTSARAELLQQALAKAGDDKLPELEAAVEARRALGVTYLHGGQRDRAREHLEQAHALLCQHVRRLQDPGLLRLVAADLIDVIGPGAKDVLVEATTRVLSEAFPESLDLILDLRVVRTDLLLTSGDVAGALELARAISKDALELRAQRPVVMLHLWMQVARVFVTAQRPSEARPLLERAQGIIEQQHLTSRNVDAREVTGQLATMLLQLGRREEAIALLDRILAESPTSTFFWQRRGRLRLSAGYLEESLADSQRALELMETGDARNQCLANIALTHAKAGRTTLALAGLEALVGQVRRRPPLNSPYDLKRALGDLGETRYELGDFRGAYPLLKEALDLWLAREGPDGLQTQRARIMLGSCGFFLGYLEEYERLMRAVRESLTRIGRQDHSRFYFATTNLAEALVAQGHWDDARRYAVEGGTAAKAAGDAFWSGLALTIEGAAELGVGAAVKAGAQLRDGLALMARSEEAAGNQEEIAWFRSKLLLALAQMDDHSSLRNEVLNILRDTKDRLDRLTALSSRERGEVMAGLQVQAEQVVALRVARPGALDDGDLFEWLATLRAIGGPLEVARQSSGDQKPRIDKLREDALVLRRRVAALVQNDIPGSETHAQRLAEAMTERDAAERALLDALPKGSKFAWITPKDLAPSLTSHDALAVTIHRIRAMPPQLAEDHFFAFVVDGTAKVRAHDLGAAKPIENDIGEWRRLVTGTDRGAGRPAAGAKGPDLQTLGVSLRQRVLDPLLQGSKQKRVFLCLDDVLNTIPWDALPLDATSLVGDRYRLAVLPSLRDLLDAGRRQPRSASLLAFGDIDYDAPGDAPSGVPMPDRPAQVSGQPFGNWPALGWSEDEIGKIGKHFQTAFQKQPQLIARGKATKAALFQQAPNAAWLHLATHGYLAPESLAARGEATAPGTGLATRGGFAPMTLCGLVLAGGNNKVGAIDEVPGIVTAEELAGLDLAGCRLAVLSGCETGLGSRRAGQGLSSLQSALHAAGAGNTVASLWRVQDKATSDLMVRFYELLWQKKLPPDEALWQAKLALRKEKRSVEAWAGWVFSGVPEKR